MSGTNFLTHVRTTRTDLDPDSRSAAGINPQIRFKAQFSQICGPNLRFSSVAFLTANSGAIPEIRPTRTENFTSRTPLEFLADVIDGLVCAKLARTFKSIPHPRVLETLQKQAQQALNCHISTRPPDASSEARNHCFSAAESGLTCNRPSDLDKSV
jgi:hypothetical protein